MEPGPSIEDFRFMANTPEVGEAFREALRIFGLEKYCQANSIEERFSNLRRYAKEPEPTNTSLPQNSLLLDVIGDGACFWYAILSLLLGRVIKKDEPVISVMKKNFTSLVIKHKDKIVMEDPNPQGTKRVRNLITFYHDSYENCCPQYNVNKQKDYHNRSFGFLRNSDHGNLKYETVEEWCKIIEMPHTWATDNVLRLFSCFTGLTILTNNHRCGPIHPQYYSYLSVSKYGFQKPIHGGEILLQWTNENHYQLLIPKYPNQLDTTVKPYQKKPQIEETVFVDKVNNNESKKAHSLKDFLKKAKNIRIEKEKLQSNSNTGKMYQQAGKSQNETKKNRKKEKKEAKAFERDKRMESLKQFDIERNKLRDIERKKEKDLSFRKDSNENCKKGNTESMSGDSVKKEDKHSSPFNVKSDSSAKTTTEEHKDSVQDGSVFDQQGICEFRILAWCAGRKTCTLKHFAISSKEGRMALAAGKKGLKRKQKVGNEFKAYESPSKLSKTDESISDINGEDLNTADEKGLKTARQKVSKSVDDNGKKANVGDGEDSKTLKNVDKNKNTEDQIEDMEIEEESNEAYSDYNREDLKTVDGKHFKSVYQKDLQANIGDEKDSKTSGNVDKNKNAEDQVEDLEHKEDSNEPNSDFNREDLKDLKTVGKKCLNPVDDKYLKEEVNMVDGEDMEIEKDSNNPYSDYNRADFKTVDGKDLKSGYQKDLKASISDEKVSKTSENVDKNKNAGDQVEDMELKEESNEANSAYNREDLKTVGGKDLKTDGKKSLNPVDEKEVNTADGEVSENVDENEIIEDEIEDNESPKKPKSKNKKGVIYSDSEDSNSETNLKETDQEDKIEKKQEIPSDNYCKEASNSKNLKKKPPTNRKSYPKNPKQKTLEHFFAKKCDDSKRKEVDDESMCSMESIPSEGQDDLNKETDEMEVGRDDLKRKTDATELDQDDLKKETDAAEVDDEKDEPEDKADDTKPKQTSREHSNIWIDQLLYKYRGNLEKIEINGKVKLRCIPCNACYKGTSYRAKMYNWAHGLEDCRTWERFKDHEESGVHASALVRWKSAEKDKAQFQKAMETVKAKEKSNYVGKNIEEMLQCKNVLRNLCSTVLQHQSTRSLYSRLGCQDYYFSDLYQAVQAKLEMAESLNESQPTDFRKEEVIKLKKLQDALPALKQLVGESQAEGYTNRSIKIRNMKLEIGEQIYSNIMDRVLNGEIHTFSSDGVEDVKVRHAVNMFLQSETVIKGVAIPYFGRIEYATEPMDHKGESKLMLHLLNHCLPGFTGYLFGGTMDGPNVHFGLKKSVSTELQIPLTRDFSHCSALVVTHSTKAIPELLQIRELLEELGRELRNSYQKMMELRAVFLMLEEDISELETCPATRWVFLRKAGVKLIKIYFEIVTFFENRAERHLYGQQLDPTAVGRLRYLKDLKFVVALYTSMDFLEPLITLNIRTQGPNRLICEKRHDVQLTTTKLKVLKTMAGPFEKELMSQLDFTEEYPKLVLEKDKEVQLRKMAGHVMRNKRSDTLESEVVTRKAVVDFIKEFKERAITRLLTEIDGCMFKDSLANHFGVFDILDMPIVPEREEGFETDFGQADIVALGEHFGNKFNVLRSFKDCTSKNGFMIKPVLQDPVLDKDALPLEFASARGEIVRTYRAAVLKSDHLTKMFENDEDDGDSSKGTYFSQKMAYEDFLRQYDGEYPNLQILVRHMLAHIPNAVACERNASNLKATLTKTRNRLEYDTLNSEMQITENGPALFTPESELLLSNVASAVLEGGFTSPNYKPKLHYMKNVVPIIDE